MLLVASESHGIGEDSHAYWLAGHRLLSGEPIYLADDLVGLGAYRYVPVFAQAWATSTLLPEVLGAWAWRLTGLLSIRYMAGSWLVAGIWMLVPGTLTELGAGNVTLQVAAVTVAGLRGHAQGVIPATIVKFSAVMVIPYVWRCLPAARRGLLAGAAMSLLVIAVSAMLDAGLWGDWWASLLRQADFGFEGTPVLHLLPTPGQDHILRVALAGGLAVAAVAWRSPHVAFVAAVLATPVVWPQRLCVLMALPTLTDDAWVRRTLR
jgi:hypothetical protein